MLAKSKLNSIEVLIFTALIDSNINHDKFVLINNVLKQLWYEGRNVWSVEKILKVKI